jgi:ABC-type sugar transport system permease subunit
MADNIFSKLGGHHLTDDAIKDIIDEEIVSHKKEEIALPVIKLKPPPKEQVITIKKKEQKEVSAEVKESKETISAAKPEIVAPELPPSLKLSDKLTTLEKLRMRYRYKKFGIPIRIVEKKKLPEKPLPVVKKEDLKKLKWLKIKKEFLGMELLLPAVLIFLFFSWLPIIKTFIISFMNFKTINESVFVGFDNFIRIFNDAKFWDAFLHSITLSFIVIIFGSFIPFFLAIYIYEMKKASGLVKILYFLPFLTPSVPAAILWKWLYNQSYGLINYILSLFIPGKGVAIAWLTDPKLVLFSIAIVFIWKNIGWAILIYLAGLHNIPKTLFEDTALNGGNIMVKIRHIILPSILPVIYIVVFMQLINSLQIFTEVYIMTNGGPEGASEVIATYIYKKAFFYMDIGYAAGVALFFLFVLVSITILRVNLQRGRN